MLRKAVASSLDIAMPIMYGDGQLLGRLSEGGSQLTKQLIFRIRAGKRAFYVPALTVDSLGNMKHLLARIGEEGEREARSPGTMEAALLKATGLAEGELLIGFPSRKRPRNAALPQFPVLLREGGWSDLFSISPIARAVFAEPHSRTAFVVYTKEEHAELVRDRTLVLLEKSA
jgi:hypothetical protein